MSGRGHLPARKRGRTARRLRPNEDGGKNRAGRAQDGIRAIPEAFAKPVAKVAPKIPSVDGAGARHCRGGG